MEENLLKLSVKELKAIARKSSVNPNLKKIDLVKALLTNLKDIPAQVNNEPDGTQASRRITRSAVSICQHPSETIDLVKEATDKDNSYFKDKINKTKVKSKTGKNYANTNDCDTFQMFPLVSTIQLASNPLIEITNNDVRHENLQNEICTAATKSKRSKRKNFQSSTLDVFSCNNTEASRVVNSDVATERDEDITPELNNVPSSGSKISISQEMKRESNRKKKNSIQEEHAFKEKSSPLKQMTEQHSIDEDYKNIDINKENHLHSKLEDKHCSKRSKREKNKPESLLTKEISVATTESQQGSSYPTKILSKTRKKKCAKKNSVQSATEIAHSSDNCSAEELCGIKINFHVPSSSSTPSNNLVTSDTVDSIKRKPQNSPLPEISNCDSVLVGKSPETSPIKPDILKENFDTSLENNDLSCKKTANSGKQKRSINKEQYVEDIVNKDFTKAIEISSRSASSLQHGHENEYTDKNVSVENSDTKKGKKSNEVLKKDIEVPSVQGEAELKASQGPIRSSTFILSEPGVTSEEASIMPVLAPRRNSTFVLADSCGNSPQVRSLRFSSAQENKKTATPQRDGKHRKSIGHRIMKASTKQGMEKELQKSQGSTLKKPNAMTTKTGSVFKKSSVTKKMPDFKKIHQQLFHNMESLTDHKKRVQDRALGLLQSPIAPRCALVSPRLANSAKAVKSPQSQDKKMAIPSPLAVKLISPMPTHTPATDRTRALVASSVNRFGFRKVVRKEEATTIIGKRLPPVAFEKKKENTRNFIKGVRMNKRFMLQMQMRNSDK